jgi:sn-glycerol 3-phosphate transport system substrate-binding protein
MNTRRILPLVVFMSTIVSCGSGKSALEAGLDEPPTTSAATPDDTAATAGDEVTTVAPAGPTGTVDSTVAAGSTDSTTASPTTTPLADLPACPTGALDGADGPVEITYWHGLNADNEEALQAVASQYNESQDRVVVDLQNQGGYLEVIDKYYQSGANGRPDLVMFPEYGFQQAIDSDTVVPVEACVQDAGFDRSSIRPSAIEAYSTAGVQWAMPFNVSNPILYFNRRMFEAAGLDPDQPPTTLDDLRAVSQQLVDSGAANFGLAIDTSIDTFGGWFLEQWFATAGELFVDHGNGREALSTEVYFDDETGQEIFTFLQQLVADGLAVNVGDNASGTDHFLKMADADQPAAMTISSSASLGTVINVLGSGLVEGLTTDDVGAGPFPGLGAVPTAVVGGAANYIVAGGDSERVAATWDFVSYLVTPEVQSQWATRTGYLPIVDDAIDIEPLATTYRDDARFRVAYEQLVNSPDDLAHAGPQIGPHRQVRGVTATALARILDGADVASTLADAADRSNALLRQYRDLNG